MLVGKALQKMATKFPDRPALIAKEGVYTYRDLYRNAVALANSLLNAGFTKGDCIGVLSRKVPETIIAYLGMGYAGTIGVPLNFHYRQDRFSQVFHLSEPRLIIIDETLLGLQGELGKFGEAERLLVIGKKNSSSLKYWSDFIAEGGDSEPDNQLQEDDVFYLNFTSGSTGNPKAVATTHGHIHWNTLSSIEALGIVPEDRHLCMFAIFSHPHEIFARPLWTGGTIILLDSLYPKSIASMITEHGVTCIMGLAPMYEMIIPFAASDRYDFSTLRLAESGGMATRTDLLERFRDQVGIPIRPVWGSTESNGVALAVPESVALTTSCGKVTPYYTIKIVDSKGIEVAQGETGEMIIKGPAVVQEYYRDPQETEKWFQQGWFHTGDMVYQDNDGLVHFRGRESGMMKVGGLKVFPQEIEEVIRQLPEVEEVVVIPAFEKLRGEVPHALVILREGERLSEQRIRDFCRKMLANYMVPKVIEFRQSFPMTPSGKIDRKALLDEVTSGTVPSEIDELGSRIEKIDLKILQLLNERTRVSLHLKKLRKAAQKSLFSPDQDEKTINKLLGYNSGPLHDEFIEQFYRDLLRYLISL